MKTKILSLKNSVDPDLTLHLIKFEPALYLSDDVYKNAATIWAATQENLSSVVCEQHSRSGSLISTFVIHVLESIIFRLAMSEISIF